MVAKYYFSPCYNYYCCCCCCSQQPEGSDGRNPDRSLWDNEELLAKKKKMDGLTINNNEENNVFKSANLFAAPVPENTLKLRTAVSVEENRVPALV